MFFARILVGLAINAAALWVADELLDGVQIEGLKAFLIGAAVLGIANAIIRPVLMLLTLPLILITLGLFLLVINIAMLALASWITPDFDVSGFWAYLGAVVIIWIVNFVADRAFGRE
jgi:putative membrane protein